MSSRFSNVRPFRGRQQRALDSTTAPVPDEDINQLVERGDPVRQLPALKLLPRLQRGRSDRDSHPVAPEQGVPHAAAPSVQGRESALLFFALSNSAAVDGFHFFAHNHTRGGMPWVRLTGGGGRSQRDPRTENTRRRVRQRSMVRGLHFRRHRRGQWLRRSRNVVDTAQAAAYTCFGIKVAGQNASRVVNIDLVAGERGSDFIADLWFTGSLPNVNNGLLATGSSADSGSSNIPGHRHSCSAP
jgi:hypothetical protein